MSEKMRWKNLQDMECPKCGNMLNKPHNDETYFCSNLDCDFKIGEERFNEVVGSLYTDISRKRDIYEEPDRSDWD